MEFELKINSSYYDDLLNRFAVNLGFYRMKLLTQPKLKRHDNPHYPRCILGTVSERERTRETKARHYTPPHSSNFTIDQYCT